MKLKLPCFSLSSFKPAEMFFSWLCCAADSFKDGRFTKTQWNCNNQLGAAPNPSKPREKKSLWYAKKKKSLVFLKSFLSSVYCLLLQGGSWVTRFHFLEFHCFMASVRMVNSVEWSPAAKKGTEKRRRRQCDKKYCKLCKVMRLETTRPHLLAPLESCASVSVGEGLCVGWEWRYEQVFSINVQHWKWQPPEGLCRCHLVKWANKATGAVKIISPWLFIVNLTFACSWRWSPSGQWRSRKVNRPMAVPHSPASPFELN